MGEVLTYEDHKGLEELQVGLFFYVNDDFAFAGCPISEAEKYGDFLIYSKSHYDIWNNKLAANNPEFEYDYFPRGRVVYRTTDETFIIYYDKCIENEMHRITSAYEGYKYKLELDEHYCCHMCNEDYCF